PPRCARVSTSIFIRQRCSEQPDPWTRSPRGEPAAARSRKLPHSRPVAGIMTTPRGAAETIREAVMSWPGVEAVPHRFGGTEYRYGRREMGHVHGDWLVDLPMPRKVHHEAIAAGRAEPHHGLPDSGWC